MTSTYKQIIPPKLVEAVVTSQYTAVNAKANILKATATNVGAGNETLTVHIVPTGDTPTNANLYIDAQPIGVGQTYKCPEIVGHGLEPGWQIYAFASAAASLRIAMTGDEIT